MKPQPPFALRTTTTLSQEAALALATELLKAEGFGILTEIDVQATLLNKLGVERGPYRILGACKPALAHAVLEVEPLVGVLLPCNVVVWDEGPHRVVAAMEPLIMSHFIEDPRLAEAAGSVSASLKRVLAALESAAE
jgi:uncharacterized protein (DUF302 family)